MATANSPAQEQANLTQGDQASASGAPARSSLGQLELAGLGLLLGCALALRLVGAATDYPWCWYPDRDVIIHARNCINFHSPRLDPGEYIYPTGYIYLNALLYAVTGVGAVATRAVHGLHGLAVLYYEKIGFLAALTRGLGSVLTVIGILLVAILARELGGKAAGAFAAAALAFAGLDIICCHYPTTDAPAAVALLACSLVALKLYTRSVRARDYLAAGALAGVAAAIKYPAGAGLVGMALAVLLARRAGKGQVKSQPEDNAPPPQSQPAIADADQPASGGVGRPGAAVPRLPRWQSLVLLVTGAVVAFLLLMPWAVVNWPTFAADLFYQSIYNRTGPEPAWQFGRFFFHFVPAAGVGQPLNILALAGLAALALRHKRKAAVVLAGPLLVYLSFVSTTRFVPRWYEMLVPFIALGVGLAFAWAAQALPVNRLAAVGLAAAVLGLLLVGPMRLAAQYDRLLLQRGSRAVATQWAREHIAPHSSVAVTQWLWAGPDLPQGLGWQVQWVLPGSPERLYAGLRLKWILDDDLGAWLKSSCPRAYEKLRSRQAEWLSRGTTVRELVPDYRLQAEWVIVNLDYLYRSTGRTARGWTPVPGQPPQPYLAPLLSQWRQKLTDYLTRNYEVLFSTPPRPAPHPWGLWPYGSPQIVIYRRCSSAAMKPEPAKAEPPGAENLPALPRPNSQPQASGGGN